MYFSAFEMQRNFEERSHALAQISERAHRIAQEVDENLTDALSLMDLKFSLDGFGRLCNDLGKTCDVSKLVKIPSKCVDLAKRFADEVSADWLGLDINPTDIESLKITRENIEVSNDKSEEEHDSIKNSGIGDTSAMSEISIDNSESTNSNDASDQEYVENLLSGSELREPVEERQENVVSDVCLEHNTQNEINEVCICVCHRGSSSVVPGESKYALPEGCHCGSSSVVPSDKTDDITAEADNLISLPVIIKSVDQNALVQVSKSHDGISTLGSSDKTVETAAEPDNLVNFSKPIEVGGFEDVDLKDDWEDDIDYDLDMVSYFESNKKPSKKKMAAKFISRLRHSIKPQSVEVVHKPDVKSTDSDWEIL